MDMALAAGRNEHPSPVRVSTDDRALYRASSAHRLPAWRPHRAKSISTTISGMSLPAQCIPTWLRRGVQYPWLARSSYGTTVCFPLLLPGVFCRPQLMHIDSAVPAQKESVICPAGRVRGAQQPYDYHPVAGRFSLSIPIVRRRTISREVAFAVDSYATGYCVVKNSLKNNTTSSAASTFYR